MKKTNLPSIFYHPPTIPPLTHHSTFHPPFHFIPTAHPGTAAVAVAGIITSTRITKNKLIDHKYLFLGAGEVCVCVCIRHFCFHHHILQANSPFSSPHRNNTNLLTLSPLYSPPHLSKNHHSTFSHSPSSPLHTYHNHHHLHHTNFSPPPHRPP